MEDLNDSNFILYAAKYYDNPQCYDTTEFYEDLKRFKYIKRLINRYIRHGDLKERLILNHIIALNNVFGPHATVKMLFMKLSGHEQYIAPFLSFLSILPSIVEIGDSRIYTTSIPTDFEITKRLRNL